ncbi:TPA: hypothetical protein DCZ15_03695 [Candidatus Falkowbacteria bacterium]|nr:MAG: hypothetical protein UV95_C0004G0114 [Candidatus Falkowbacteria bacterium GW2011_GWF2_43_32]HBA36947.1 hypothetical protein [Candidatus Falkowbacteria bacterium]
MAKKLALTAAEQNLLALTFKTLYGQTLMEVFSTHSNLFSKENALITINHAFDEGIAQIMPVIDISLDSLNEIYKKIEGVNHPLYVSFNRMCYFGGSGSPAQPGSKSTIAVVNFH